MNPASATKETTADVVVATSTASTDVRPSLPFYRQTRNRYGDILFILNAHVTDKEALSRNLRVTLPQMCAEFHEVVVWIRIPIALTFVIPLLRRLDFMLHSIEDTPHEYIVMTRWTSPHLQDRTPDHGTHFVKVYPIVVWPRRRVASEDAENHIVIVRERYPSSESAHRRRVDWKLPSGNVTRGETIETACIREVREELSLAVEFDGIVGFANRPSHTRGRNEIIVFARMRLCDPKQPALVIQREELVDAKWISVRDISEASKSNYFLRGFYKRCIFTASFARLPPLSPFRHTPRSADNNNNDSGGGGGLQQMETFSCILPKDTQSSEVTQ